MKIKTMGFTEFLPTLESRLGGCGGFFFLSEYISVMKFLCLPGNFNFPCSYTEYIFLIILLFAGRFTYRLSSSSRRNHRNKLLSIWKTMDIFIKLSFSKDNIQILS